MRIELVGAEKTYGDVRALSGVDLDTADGEFLTLLGPSGCGKTTLLRVVAGFEALDRGELRFEGRPVRSLPPERRGVGLLFQNYALFPHMDVAANVGYGLRFKRGMAREKRRARASELLDLVGLGGFERRMPGQLSAGQQQRVAIARALATDPRALLLDEPLSALDAALRERLRLEIRQLQQRLGLTLIYVTHDQAEALSISDRIAVMRDGNIEQIGTPVDVYDRPATPFVARFVGAGNLLDPSAEWEGGAQDESWVVIRPEHLWIDGVHRRAAREDGGIRFRAEVEFAEFLGEAVTVHLKAPSGARIRSSVYDPGRRAAALGLAPGTSVLVGCRPESVHAIPRSH